MKRAANGVAALAASFFLPAIAGWPVIASGQAVAVGRTAGSFAVSATGQANYSIPIWTPKGIAGLTPSLSLSYSSGRGDGMYGVGWSVVGFSAINRCPKTYGQDGFSANVFLTTADLYCLDGNKLRSFAGTTYGADGAQYQTEIADFSLVISHGTAGAGPAWFEVHGKNGLIYQYGNTAHSALLATGTSSVITWALNRITDRFGNHVDFDYTNDTTNQVLRPATITYTTPSSGATPNYQVQFTYVARTSSVPGGFVTGAQFMEPYLAQAITVDAWNGSAYAAVRTYNLTYTTGTTTGRSQLTTIQECSPTQCFPATTVGYQNGTAGWSAAVATSANSYSLNAAIVADLNGDGIDDIVYKDATSGHTYYMLGTTSGTFQGPYDLGIAGTTPLFPIDYNGDGKTDLMLPNSSGKWRIMSFVSPGAAFTITDTTTPVPPTVGGYVMTGDVDGDGRDDLIYAVSSGSSWGSPDHIYYRLNTGSGFGAEQTLAIIGSSGCNPGFCQKLTLDPFGVTNVYNSRVRHADVNGDGRIDFFVNIESCNIGGSGCTSPTFHWNLYVSDATTVAYDSLDILSYGGTGLASNLVPPLFGDFNGDGCSDVASNHGGIWYLQYGTCLRTGATNALSAAVNTGVAAYGVFPMAIDWDGDGMDDIVEANAATGGTLGYAKSTGTTLKPWTSTGIAYNNGDSSGVPAAVVLDTNGDGLYEIAFPVTSTYVVSVLPHKGATVTADLATSFTDGFGVNYSPTYEQLTNSSLYTKGTGAVFPEQDVQTPMTVVSSYSASDGIGGTYTVSKFYTGARQNVRRRESEGFASVRTIDSRDSLYRYTYFGQLFPQTGVVSRQSVYQSNGSTFISDVQNTLLSATLDATYNRYFPYVSQSIANAYEFGGTLNGSLITQKTTTVAFNGPNAFTYGNPSQITTTTVDKDPTSPWPSATFTDTINMTPYEVGGTSPTGWCIHLSSQITEQRTQPSGAALTHTTAYGVNANSECEVDSKTVEPSSTADKVVMAYLYDGCGNTNSISVTGRNPDGTPMAARTSTSAYGSHCIFPETVTNALLQSASLGYRYDLGLPTSSTDPNNLITSWTYNDIGQKTLEQRPDGTQTAFSLAACSSPSYCGDSTLRYAAYRYEQDSTASHTTYFLDEQLFDLFGRLKYDEPEQSNGAYATVLTSYDALGRLSTRTNPYGNGFSSYNTTFNYDALNRVTSKSRPISSSNSTLEYTHYTYQGRTYTVQDPKGYTTTQQSDVIGELGIVTDPDGISKTNYSYNPFGQLTLIQDPAGNQTTRSYDTLGYLLTGSSDPDRGAWTYQYDSLGEMINLRDAKTSAPSWTQTLSYDALGRTTQRVESEGTTTWTWGTSASAHEIGQLNQLAGLSDTESYTYDSAGRPSTRSMLWSATTYSVGYNYNTIGKLNQLIYPLAAGYANPFTVLYSYTHGYLSSLQDYTGNVAGTTFWQLTPGVINMDPWGHVVDETLGTSSAVRIQSAYDAVTSWMNTRTVGSGGSLNNIQNLAYQWDLNGNLSQRQDQIQNLTEVFNYDNLNRIQTSTLNGLQNLSVSIDNTGNISSRTEGGITYPYTYDTTHKHAVDIVGTSPNQTTYNYDANGNMSTRNGASLTWASYNLPLNINGPGGVFASFSYGPDRQRKQQSAKYVADGQTGTETTVYVFGLYEYETTPAQTHSKYFIQVPGGTQVIYDIQSVNCAQTTYVTADHLGSGNIFLSSAGNVEIKESYSAYGYRRSSNWSGPLSTASSDYTTISSTTRRGYTDAFHEMLDNLALIHMNGRVYDPVIGRFMSPDPVVTQLGDSQRGNPYSYASNRPLTLTDPTGLAQSSTKPKEPAIIGRTLAYIMSVTPGLRRNLFGGVMGVEGSGAPGGGDYSLVAGDNLNGSAINTDVFGQLFNDTAPAQASGGGQSAANPQKTADDVLAPTSAPAAENQPGSSTKTSNSEGGAGEETPTSPGDQPQGGLQEVVVTGTRQPESPAVAQTGLPPGIEIIIEGTRMSREPPVYTPEQPVPSVPRGPPVQSPINPPAQSPGNKGWLPWKMLELFFRGFFNMPPSIVTPTPTDPPECRQQLCA